MTDFVVGDRYRNRLGWYEVLEIKGQVMKVRYESNEREDDLEMNLQRRIISNIAREERRQLPHEEDIRNHQYFKSIGFLAKNGFIEAIIPPKSKTGFDRNYLRIKCHMPQHGQQGYYIHNDPNVEKWGVEMRLTFSIPTFNLDFGGSYVPVKSPDPNKLRVNSNELCYRLLEMGFNLGEHHDVAQIESNIPERYRTYFQEGVKS